MQIAYLFELYLMKALSIVAAVIAIMALVDAVRRPAANFVSEGKRTKPFWMAITGAAMVLGFLTVFSPLNLFALLAIVGAAVFLADVRPALRQVMGRGGGSTHMGPYGPW